MNSTATLERPAANAARPAQELPEHNVEIISDSGEGAQRCGQSLAAIAARSGNGIWTVEIIPAEIQPPPRVPEDASGNRIRVGSGPVTNWGDETNTWSSPSTSRSSLAGISVEESLGSEASHLVQAEARKLM